MNKTDLTSYHNLKAITKGMSDKEFFTFHEIVQKIAEERTEEIDNLEKFSRQKREELKAAIEKAKSNGVDVSAILSEQGAILSERRKVKYRAVIDGRLVEWSGVGMMPKALKNEIAKGRALTEFETFRK